MSFFDEEDDFLLLLLDEEEDDFSLFDEEPFSFLLELLPLLELCLVELDPDLWLLDPCLFSFSLLLLLPLLLPLLLNGGLVSLKASAIAWGSRTGRPLDGSVSGSVSLTSESYVLSPAEQESACT